MDNVDIVTATATPPAQPATATPPVQPPQGEKPPYKEENLIYESKEFTVWLDEKLYVWWQTENCFAAKLEELQKGSEWGEIISRQTALEALPISLLSEESKRGFRFQIGNAILLLFTEKFEHARKSMDAAEVFYRARMAEQARMWILQAGLSAAIIVTASVCITGWIGKVVVLQPGNLFEQIMEGAFFGVWGTFISLIMRASVLGIDASAGRPLHYMEATCRIITGCVAGGIVVCAVAAGIISPGLLKLGSPIILLLGFTGGFSERMLPSLVGKVEATVHTDKPAKNSRLCSSSS